MVCRGHGKRPADSLTARPSSCYRRPSSSSTTPIVPFHRGTDTWATVVSRGPPMPDRFFLVSSWTANISLPFWPIKRDISSPPISLNAIRRQTSSTAICVELTNCRHALRCILGGQDHTIVSLRCWTLHRRRLK